jgi:anaerobic selenocysteine-containing dehydrogenase
VDEDYPFQLTTGRTVYHWHIRTKTRWAPQLNDAAPQVWVELAESDADRLGISEGDAVVVRSRRGHIRASARITGSRPGVVFAPFHYGYFDRSTGPDDEPTAANELTRTEWDPVSKQPVYKVTAVAVERDRP